jgi:thiol-disulfide isomerase/thioredoxin
MPRALLILILWIAIAGAGDAAAQENARVDAYLFWRTGCPFCEKAEVYLGRLEQEIPELRVERLEVSSSEANRALFIALSRALEIERPVVPIVVVGSRAFVGYLDDATTGAAIRQAVQDCRDSPCDDLLASLRTQAAPTRDVQRSTGTSQTSPQGIQTPRVPESIDLPLLGEIDTRALSLPLLTVVLGAVDGFNPCALWVLVFLMGLLIGLEDHKRMWLLGGAFLLASGGAYFVFMAAWLNVLLFLGAVLWIRVAIALVALGGGAFYLREFVLNSEAVCKAGRPERRHRIMDGLRSAVRERELILAVSGVVVLAIAVNLIELICSAGIPAVYTQVLSLTPMPAWQYYLYLLIYIAVFLLDDLIVFATAMVTLQAGGLTAKYSRYAHLVGGIILCALGALLLLQPEWLMFG